MSHLPAMFQAVMKAREEKKFISPVNSLNSLSVVNEGITKEEIVNSKPKKKIVREYLKNLVDIYCNE